MSPCHHDTFPAPRPDTGKWVATETQAWLRSWHRHPGTWGCMVEMTPRSPSSKGAGKRCPQARHPAETEQLSAPVAMGLVANALVSPWGACLREHHGVLTPPCPLSPPSSGSSDPYCVVKVDDEVVAR